MATEEHEEDSDSLQLLDYAIEYCVHGSYPEGLTKGGVQILRRIPEVFGPPGPSTSKYLDRGGGGGEGPF